MDRKCKVQNKTLTRQDLSSDFIQKHIFLIRGYKVMVDADLAKLYHVPTKRLKEQVRRNIKRFPDDFMFELTWDEAASLRSHFATLKQGRHMKYRPFAFTEQGVAMLSSILNSDQAVDVNIAIMRAFVKLREVLSTHKELLYQFKELENKVGRHDEQIKTIFEAIRQLMRPVEEKPKPKIGFHVDR